MPKPISLDEIIMDAYKTYKPEELEEYKPTNADRIRAMSDEELAEFLIDFENSFGTEYEGVMSCLDWLQEAEE